MTAPFDITCRPPGREVKRARDQVGHTQKQAIETLGGRHPKEWSGWERDERAMSLNTWKIYLLLTDQHPTLRVVPRAQPKMQRQRKEPT